MSGLLLYIFKNFCSVWLYKEGWILPASVSSTLQYVVLAEICKENPASHSCAIGKARSILKYCQIVLDTLI